MQNATLAAEYSEARTGGGWLDLVNIDVLSNRRTFVARGLHVNGKREARRVARERGAIPWNF